MSGKVSKYPVGCSIQGFLMSSRYRDSKNNAMGVFICKHCGDEFNTRIHSIVSENTKSCGCLTSQGKAAGKSQLTHGLSGSPLHSRWMSIKSRCYNENHKAYKNYGGRGISLWEPWHENPKSFYDYVTQLESYPGLVGIGKGKLTLDRIDNDGNYEPGNLRWATMKVQNNNKRTYDRRKDNTI